MKIFKSKIIHIPGHTSGHICFYFENDKIAFTGDTFFPWAAEEYLKEVIRKCLIH